MFWSIAYLVLVVLLTLLQIRNSCAAPNNFGINTLATEPRIINGTLASLNATKHQVSIRRKRQDGYFFGTGHICGGSLIRDNVVLSAAHCFVDKQSDNGIFLPDADFIAVMGNLDRFNKDENTLIFNLQKIVYDVGYFNESTFDKDIALLFLNGSVPKNHTTVEPINITTTSFPAGTVCQVTGWGQTENDDVSDMLMTVDVPLISFSSCTNDTDFPKGIIHEGMLCAGYLQGGRDACSGDSGGPLVCNGRQAGIVSWGSGCAEPKLPGVYTDVAYYASWIEKNIRGGATSNFNRSATFLGFLFFLAKYLI